MLRPTRIVVAAMPRVLRDIIEGVVKQQTDMMLIAGREDAPLSEIVHDADVVIICEPETSPAVPCEQLLVGNPHLKLVVVTGQGRQAHLLELHRVPVGQVSPQSLVEAIRTAVSADREAAAPVGTSDTDVHGLR